MSVQIARGPGYRIQGTRIETSRNLRESSITHDAAGVEMTYSAKDDTIFLQGAERKANFGTVRADIFTKYDSERSELLVSSQKDFAEHVALSLAGVPAAALSTTDGSMSQMKLNRENSQVVSIETERALGEVDAETKGGLGLSDFDGASKSVGEVYNLEKSPGEPESVYQLAPEHSMEWLTIHQSPF